MLQYQHYKFLNVNFNFILGPKSHIINHSHPPLNNSVLSLILPLTIFQQNMLKHALTLLPLIYLGSTWLAWPERRSRFQRREGNALFFVCVFAILTHSKSLYKIGRNTHQSICIRKQNKLLCLSITFP